MVSLRMVAISSLILLGAVGLTGCGGGKTVSTPELEAKGKLIEVSTMLRNYAAQTNKAPTKIADLASFQNSMDETYQLVKSGEVIVVWGIKMPGEGDKGNEAVIAYEKKASTDKGLVLLHNGNITNMDAAALTAALKVK